MPLTQDSDVYKRTGNSNEIWILISNSFAESYTGKGGEINIMYLNNLLLSRLRNAQPNFSNLFQNL